MAGEVLFMNFSKNKSQLVQSVIGVSGLRIKRVHIYWGYIAM